MHDPYLTSNGKLLKNKLGVKSQRKLDDAEANYVSLRIREIYEAPIDGKYDVEHFCSIHKYIFQDVYDWAGMFRVIDIEKEEPALGGLSVEYAKHRNIEKELAAAISGMTSRNWAKMSHEEIVRCFSGDLAKIWKVHPFREGNTRTTIIFCTQFIKNQELKVNNKLFEENSLYMRTALVAYNAIFSDLGDYSKKEYLERIITDAVKM